MRKGPAPLAVVQRLPPLPADVRKRFPSLKEWEDKMEKWRVETNNALGGGAG